MVTTLNVLMIVAAITGITGLLGTAVLGACLVRESYVIRNARREMRTISRMPHRNWPPEVKTSYDRLYAALNTNQRKTLTQYEYINVTTNLGNVYRIECDGDFQGNVYLMVNGKHQRCYCAHIAYSVWKDYPWPVYDHYLAQALMLRTDERKFLKIAMLGWAHEYADPGDPAPAHVGVMVLADHAAGDVHPVCLG